MNANTKTADTATASAGSYEPTPWKAEPVKGRYESHIWRTVGGSLLIAETGGLKHAENAAFIVQACNSHADLLAAVKDCEGELNLCRDTWGKGLPGTVARTRYEFAQQAIDQARAAIARAEGREALT